MLPQFLESNSYEYNFPSRDINPDEKGTQYCLNNARSVYSLFLRSKTAWGIVGQKDFFTCRQYSRGEQNVEQYQSWLLNEDPNNGNDSSSSLSFDDTAVGKIAKREGWQNIMWKNISPLPSILNSIHGIFDKQDWDIYCDTIDANSQALKENEKYRRLCEAKNASWQIEYKKNAGIPIDEEVELPRSPEELAMFEARDGFKLNVAKAMQKLTRYTFQLSDWDGNIRKKLIDDLVTIGYAAVRDYFDSADHKWKVGYLDPERLVIQYSSERDYDDAEYAGYFRYETISNLRNKLPNVPEIEWFNLAKACYTLYGNPRDRWANFYSELDPTTGTYRYDGFKVPIFEVEWMDTDIEKKLHYTSVRGRQSIIPMNANVEVKPLSADKIKAGASQEVKEVYKRVVRSCFWVINTDHVYDWGIVKMAAREGLSKPHLTFHVEQLLQPSLVKRMIPIADQISQLFLRWQNSLAMMVERGYAINTSMLANITFGGQKMRPAEVLKMWQQTGRLLYSYANTPTGQYSGGAALPVVPMEGGLGQRVEETMGAMQMQFTLLERLTGVNLLSMASPQGGEAVGVQQMASQATNNVLKPILDSIFEIKKSAATSAMRRLQIGLRNSDKIKEAYTGIISPSDMDAMLLMEGDGVQYGIQLKAKPDRAQKEAFINWINIALQNVREQRPGIDLPDAMYFQTALDRGEDMYELVDQLRYTLDKNKKEAEALAQRNMEAQSEAQAKAKQMEQQGQMMLDNNLAKGKMMEEQVRGDVKARNTSLEQNYQFLEGLRQAADVEQGIQTTTRR
jgi:hypothetical protein